MKGGGGLRDRRVQDVGAGSVGSRGISLHRNRLEVGLLGKAMDLLGVSGWAKYRARVGRHYVACEGFTGACMMAAVEEVTYELSDGSREVWWLCTACADKARRADARIAAEDRRQVLKSGRVRLADEQAAARELAAKANRVTLSTGRVKRSRQAVRNWSEGGQDVGKS